MSRILILAKWLKFLKALKTATRNLSYVSVQYFDIQAPVAVHQNLDSNFD